MKKLLTILIVIGVSMAFAVNFARAGPLQAKNDRSAIVSPLVSTSNTAENMYAMLTDAKLPTRGPTMVLKYPLTSASNYQPDWMILKRGSMFPIMKKPLTSGKDSSGRNQTFT